MKRYLSLLLVVFACGHTSGTVEDAPPDDATQITDAPKRPPNIVFILTDDLSWNLITPEIAPHIVQLEKQGETFDHYFVSDSLCCPSRSTMFTSVRPG